jgi:hypothetical protein
MGIKNKTFARLGAAGLVVGEPIVDVGIFVKGKAKKVRANYRDNKEFIEEQQAKRAEIKAHEAEVAAAQPEVLKPDLVST